MEIEFFGANCFRIKTKRASIVIDDTMESYGKKSVVKEGEALCLTKKELATSTAQARARLVIDGAGEYEVGDVSVKALQARAHLDEEGSLSATVYQFLYDGTTVSVLGHIHPDVSDDLLELVAGTDVMIVPVGGNGYTLDAVGATSLVKKIEPEVVIPSHYELAGFSYEVPQAPLDEFLKTSALQTADKRENYKTDKPITELVGQTHIVELQPKN